MPKRTKLEGKMDFLQDTKLEMAKKFELDIREPEYNPETFPEGKMAQPGIRIQRKSGGDLQVHQNRLGTMGEALATISFPCDRQACEDVR